MRSVERLMTNLADWRATGVEWTPRAKVRPTMTEMVFMVCYPVAGLLVAVLG